MHELRILEVDPAEENVVESPLGKIWETELIVITNFLSEIGKEWEDINMKTLTYIAGDRIPYKCGNGKWVKGGYGLDGYTVKFKFHGEHTPIKEAKPNQKYGRRPKN